MVLYPILLSQSWSTTVPNFMLVSGIAQLGQNLALSLLAKQHTHRSTLSNTTNNALFATVVPTKSDSDVIFCLKLLSVNINLYTPLELTRIDRSLVN